MYAALIAAFVVALILTVVAMALGRKGPWGTPWTFFLVLFLALWLVGIYVRSIGPSYLGVAWVPIAIAGVLLAFLLAAALPDANHWRDESIREGETGKPTNVGDGLDIPKTGAGRFFWILILLMVMAIVIGMTNPQPAM